MATSASRVYWYDCSRCASNAKNDKNGSDFHYTSIGFGDHNLSELSDFADVNPTSEVLARTIYRKLSERLNDGVRKVYKVRIGESENSAVTYYED